MNKILLVTIFLISVDTRAELISEKMWQYYMLSNAISTTTNTMKLLEMGEKHYKRIEEYQLIIEDKIMLADRIQLWALDLKEMAETDINSHEEFNNMLVRLRNSKRNLENFYYDIRGDKNNFINNEIDAVTDERRQKGLHQHYVKEGLKSTNSIKAAAYQTAKNTGVTMTEQSKTNLHLIELRKSVDKIGKHISRMSEDELAKRAAKKNLMNNSKKVNKK